MRPRDGIHGGTQCGELPRRSQKIDAVVRNLEVFGEAAKRVSDRIRSQAPDVPWRKIAGLRDVLIQDYFGIDLDIVCDVALLKVPRLRCVLDDVLRLFGGPGTTKA